MVGNREQFEAAMLAGNDATWDENWVKAVESFMIAVREFPENTQACNSLGFALFQVGRLEDAYRVYGQAHRLNQNDPLPVEKSADILERLGRMNEAAKQHLTAAEIYLAQHDIEKAIDNWERATEITPGLVKIHQRLAQAYERIGQRNEAINQYLRLAYHFQQAGNQQVALQALERALRINPREPAVLNAITAVRANNPLPPDMKVASDGNEAEDQLDMFGINPEVGDADARGPIGEAVEASMERLATLVFEKGMMDAAGMGAIQAIEMHRAGITDAAIPAYEQAEAAGLRDTPLLLNLGVLYLDSDQWDKAIDRLQKVSGDTTMTAGAAHGLALAYLSKGEYRRASKNIINTLRLVDMSLAMSDEEQAQLMNVYSRLNSLMEGATEDILRDISIKFSERLTGADWKRRVTQTRTQLEELISQGEDNILEAVAQSEDVLTSMSKIEEYMSQKRYNLAMDEAHYVLESSSDYLAAHQKIAHIMMELGHVAQAVTKFNLLVETYMVRGDERKAADILNNAIEIAPADTRLRENLINMLEKQERWSEVVDQCIQLADTYRDLTDLPSARTTLDQAQRIGQRTNISQDKMIDIMRRLAAVDMDRLEMRGALRTYQKILDLAPIDNAARRKVVELQFGLNNSVSAVQELDKLLKGYAQQRQPNLILQTLEDLSQLYPEEMSIRQYLSTVYQQMKRGSDALAQLEKLRELQYDAGLHEEARQTIKRIISLNPPNSAHYQQLLRELGG